jgi:prevent-host-death family protein
MQVGIKKAKAHLSALLKRVERGGTVIGARRGLPVALLAPLTKAHQRTRIGGLFGRPYRMGSGFDGKALSKHFADMFGVARGW